MRVRHRWWALAAALLGLTASSLLLVGCDGSDPEERPSGSLTGSIFVELEPWEAPEVSLRTSAIRTAAETALTLSFEPSAKGEAAGQPLEWMLEVGGAEGRCAGHSGWTVEGTRTEASASGSVEDGGSVTATLTLERAEGLEACEVTLTLIDGVGTQHRVHVTVPTSEVVSGIE